MGGMLTYSKTAGQHGQFGEKGSISTQLRGKTLLPIHESFPLACLVALLKSIHFVPGTTLPRTLSNSRIEAQKLLHSRGLFCDVMRE